jgi:hypothetical protein
MERCKSCEEVRLWLPSGRDNRAVLVRGARNQASLGRKQSIKERWFYGVIDSLVVPRDARDTAAQ